MMNYGIDLRNSRDGLVRADHQWPCAPGGRLPSYPPNVWIGGNQPTDRFGASWYPFGAMLYWRCDWARQLEFHAYRMGGYSAVFTLVANDDDNQVQVRQKGDTNSITFTYGPGGEAVPMIGTEKPKTSLRINPTGSLDLAPAGRLTVQGEPIEDFIRRIVKSVT